MGKYLIKRLLLVIPTMFIVAVAVFSTVRLMPGDAVTAQLEGAPRFDPKQLEDLRASLGLDKPAIEQFGIWIGNVVRGDLGDSLWSGAPVGTLIADALPVTLELAALGFIIGAVFGVILGLASAAFPNTLVDHASRVYSSVGMALPTFAVGTLVIILAGKYMGYAPPLGRISIVDDPGTHLKQYLIPAAVLGVSLSSTISRMLRTTMLEIASQDFVRTALAKGVAPRAILTRHMLPNALMSVLGFAGVQMGYLLGGTVLIESIFNLPGLGRLTLDAVYQRDYPVIQGLSLYFALMFVAVNLFVDVLNGLIDPRVKLG